MRGGDGVDSGDGWAGLGGSGARGGRVSAAGLGGHGLRRGASGQSVAASVALGEAYEPRMGAAVTPGGAQADAGLPGQLHASWAAHGGAGSQRVGLDTLSLRSRLRQELCMDAKWRACENSAVRSWPPGTAETCADCGTSEAYPDAYCALEQSISA
jgi:hypothetical protein